MKRLIGILTMALLLLSVMPMVMATYASSGGISVDITPEAFGPLIWQCDSRVVYDDALQGGRDTGFEDEMYDRVNNYAFEGEQILWSVLVMDKNKIEEITDVVATIGSTQGVGNAIEVECVEDLSDTSVDSSCNARILEEEITDFDELTMRNYDCTLTVETANSMYGEYFVTIEAIGIDGRAIVDENEYWLWNQVIGLTVLGDLVFTDVRPGTIDYSDTLLLSNDADLGSGVLLDMFISGTDFYDPASSGARCPSTNRLKLGDQVMEDVTTDGSEANSDYLDDDTCDIDSGLTADDADHLCYYASQGAYSTEDDPRNDAEGYVPIEYADTFSTAFYNDAEIMGPSGSGGGGLISLGGVDYWAGNILSPGAEIAITFKLGLPEPCVGDFSDGSLYFWGEAI